MPRLHNTYHKTAPPGSVYIGRGTPWGNPFVIGKHGTRDEVCDKFDAYLLTKPYLIARIKKELKGKDLVCCCKPARCHGETLLQIANEPKVPEGYTAEELERDNPYNGGGLDEG